MRRHPRWAPVLLGPIVTLLGVVAAAAPAGAHSVAGNGPTNFRTDLSRVDPPLPDIAIRVIERGSKVELDNPTEREVVVLGYEREPYLRVGPDGVFENTRSAATYINVDSTGEAVVPPEVDPTADPEWRKVSDDHVVRWDDHRIHWMGTRDPPVVRRAPGERHVIESRWVIPLEVEGQRVEVTGTLVWVPGPSPAPFLGGAAVLGVLTAVLLGGRRPGWMRPLALASGCLVVLDVVHAAGLAWSEPGSAGVKAATLLAASFLPAIGWVAGLLGARMLWRGNPDGAFPSLLCGLFVFGIGGLADLLALSRSQVPFALGGADVARTFVVLSLGAGGGTAIAAGVQARRAGLSLTSANTSPTAEPEPTSGSGLSSPSS